MLPQDTCEDTMAEAFVSYAGKIADVHQRSAQDPPYGSRRRGASGCLRRALARVREEATS
jgi:hypothetical protein